MATSLAVVRTRSSLCWLRATGLQERKYHGCPDASSCMRGAFATLPSGSSPFTCLRRQPKLLFFSSTAVRYQSTTPTSQVLDMTDPPVPPAPSPINLDAPWPINTAATTVTDVLEPARELTLAELGLCHSTPVGMVQNILEYLHLELGLPWWGAIVAGTIVARFLIFPVIVKGQREAAKLNNHMPEISRLTARMNEAKQSGNKFDFSKAYSELSLYQKKHDVNPLRGFLVPLIQAPVFISFFVALRKMSYLPVPSMQTGGLWWFHDLTASDPFFILPVAVTCTMWAILELGAESGVDNPNLHVMKTVFRVMPLIILPLTINFPTAIFTYWMTSNLFSLAQVAFLRIPAVRTKLRIPERIKHDPSVLPPQEGFIKSLKKGWNNAQTAQRLEERERNIKNHLDRAAKGPLRQTFSQNPLQQREGASVAASKEKPKHPWRDTIG
ncbi:mitochondrial inner membrane protein OXA1L [Ambystoma mexicanum]|uniref:mitochondrial inner membrane protein OXA1L n=1 Tax=Ambystoma mexicanum TaxID=8296 RepID=UPI0037E870EA